MSRKRKSERDIEAEAVPEDILAEGSGPVQAVAHVAIPTDDQEPDPPARTKKKKTKKSSGGEVMVEAASGGEDGAQVPPVIEADEAPKRKDVTVEPIDELVEAAASLDTVARKRTKKSKTEEPDADEAPRKRKKSKAEVEAAADEAPREPSEPEVEAATDEAPRKRKKSKAEVEAAADEAPRTQSATGDEASGEVEAATAPLETTRDADETAASGDEASENAELEASGEGELAATSDQAEGVEAAPGELATTGEETEDGTAALPTSAAALDSAGLKQLVEALVFASDKPMTVQKLRQLTRVSDIPRLEAALFELAEDYADRGIVLQQVSGGYQFRTRTQWSQWVQQLIAGRPVRLTRAQLETLAIVAYRQPITRPEIDEIRGVDSSATLKLLMDRQLIRILGKKEEVGRPMLYGTTKEFLDFFSLGDLRELPTLREYSELTPESRQVISDELGDLPEGEGGDGNGGDGGAMGGGGDMGGEPGSSEELGAAPPEPTAADLIARYVQELDSVNAREEQDALRERGEDPREDDDGETSAYRAHDERLVLEVVDDEAPSARDDEHAAMQAGPHAELDGPTATPEVVADDAAELAEAILAMDGTPSTTGDAASPGAVVATARLANDAAELADAILNSSSVTDDLAFDLSDASGVVAEPTAERTEVLAGSLAELDPFSAEAQASAASIGDAFVGESLVERADRIAIAVAAAELEVPAAVAVEGDSFVGASVLDEKPAPRSAADEAFVAADVDEIPDPVGGATEPDGEATAAMADSTPQSASVADIDSMTDEELERMTRPDGAGDGESVDVAAFVDAMHSMAESELDEVGGSDDLARGSGGVAMQADVPVGGAPSVGLDEWPAGSGGATMNADPSTIVEGSSIGAVDPSAAPVDDAIDPVE